MIELAIHALLTQDTAIAALVGSRIYPVTLPAELEAASLPAVTYQVISSSPEFALDGTVFQSKRFDINVYSTRYLTGKTVQDAINNALTGASNTLLSDGTTYLLGAFPGIETDDYDPQSQTYRALVEYNVEWQG